MLYQAIVMANYPKPNRPKATTAGQMSHQSTFYDAMFPGSVSHLGTVPFNRSFLVAEFASP